MTEEFSHVDVSSDFCLDTPVKAFINCFIMARYISVHVDCLSQATYLVLF